MKKIYFLFFILGFIFSSVFLNAQAVTQSAFEGFSTSFDIGSFMNTSYSRWIWDEDEERCKETKIKSAGDYNTESECKADHSKPAYTLSDNFVSSWNNWSTIDFPTEETTNVKTPEVQISNQSSSSFDFGDLWFNDVKEEDKDEITVSDEILNWSNFTLNVETPQFKPKAIDGLEIANPISSFDLTFKDNSEIVLPQKTPTLNFTSTIASLLEDLGLMKPSSVENDEQNLKMLDELDSPLDYENSLYDDCNWYFENYCFRARLIDQLKTYNYESKLQVHFFISILKQIEWRSEWVGILYSYINVEDERIFNNITFDIQIPGESKKPKEYYEKNIYKFIDIPNDIKIENGEGEIEFLVIIKPNTYSHYKIKDNNYKIWRESPKDTISFKFSDNSFDQNPSRSSCKFSFASPNLQSNFLDGKDPYYTNFKLAIDMECDTSGQVIQTLPTNLLIKSRMICPNHFNTDWINKPSFYSYKEEYINNSNIFGINIPENIDGPKFKTQLILENDTLISILKQKQNQQTIPPKPGGDPGDTNRDPTPMIPYSVGLSKRCDLVEEIYSEQDELIGKLHGYFYLNQCHLKTINQHPDWTYCTNDKFGNALPIEVKLTFGNCFRDIWHSINRIHFLIYPDPNASNNDQGIWDSPGFNDYYRMDISNLWTENNEQTIYADVNAFHGNYMINRYFSDTKIIKDEAKHPSNLYFYPWYYIISPEVVYVIAKENHFQEDHFKVYYGYNENCDNIPTQGNEEPMPTLPPNPEPAPEPQPGENGGKIIITNVWKTISDFFTGWFK